MPWYNPLSWWDSTIPVESANDFVGPPRPPELNQQAFLSGLQGVTGQIGAIFDAGYSIYSRITGRVQANSLIERETVDSPIITIGHTVDLNSFYRENKTVVWLFVSGLTLFGVAIIIKKRLK